MESSKTKANKESLSYMMFVGGFGLMSIMTSFLISIIIFKGFLQNPKPISVVFFIITIIAFLCSFVLPIIRFALKRKELGPDIADVCVFITSTVFWVLFGFSSPVMEKFAPQLDYNGLYNIVNLS